MKLSEANALLDHEYLPLENGWERLEDGQLHIAARTHMIGCKGEMVTWWFSWLKDTEQYRWWHPRDHVFSDWDGPRGAGTIIGGTHLVHEYIGGVFTKLKINWRDPALVLDTSRFAEAGVSAVVYARGGPLDEPGWSAHLIHLMQDTPEGTVMRSHFWLGDFDGLGPPVIDRETRLAMLPDAAATGLQKHCSEEMSILGGFLPQLYRLYHPVDATPPAPPQAPAVNGRSVETAR